MSVPGWASMVKVSALMVILSMYGLLLGIRVSDIISFYVKADKSASRES